MRSRQTLRRLLLTTLVALGAGACSSADPPDSLADATPPETTSTTTTIGDSADPNDPGTAAEPDTATAAPTADSSGTVHAEATYEIQLSTEVYAQALSHESWNSDEATTIDLLVDVREPIGAPPNRPAVILIHGGGFRSGARDEGALPEFAEHFAARGWVTFSIDYRLVDDVGTVSEDWLETTRRLTAGATASAQDQAVALYPAARDAKAAVRWIHAHSNEYQLDTERITAIGGSAGSYLSIMLGVTDAEDFRGEIDPATDPTLATTNLDQSAEIHTIIDHWGGVAHPRGLQMIDGQTRFDSSDAPILIVHGTDDQTVSIDEAETLVDAYTQTGVRFDYHPIDGAGHGPWRSIIDGQTLPELAFDFIVETQNLTVD